MEQPVKGLRIDCSLGGAAPILKRNPELEDVQRRVCLLGVLTHTREEHQIIERERGRQTDRQTELSWLRGELRKSKGRFTKRVRERESESLLMEDEVKQAAPEGEADVERLG